MAASIVIGKNRSRVDGMAEGYLILKIVMWVIELRYQFESHAKVAIERQFVGWGGPPGPEYACAGNGRRGRESGPEAGKNAPTLNPRRAAGLGRLRHCTGDDVRGAVCGILQ
jgi:hypothetical protein